MKNTLQQRSELDFVIDTLNRNIERKKRDIKNVERKTQLNDREKIYIGHETEFIQTVERLMKLYRVEVEKGLGKLTPQAIDLEESVLGALILESKNELAIKVYDFLRPEHFYMDSHKEIYSILIALKSKDTIADIKIVINELRRIGKIEMIGGAYYIAELTAKVCSAANVEYHSRVLVEMAIKREILIFAGQLLCDAYEDTSDCFDLHERLKTEYQHIKEGIICQVQKIY